VPADQDVESVGKWRILKNIAVISVAFLLQFTAFQGTGSLQSPINAAGGLGTTSLSAVFGAIIISCAFIPTLAIRKLTAKWTLCLSMLCYVPYIMSQFYPQFYTLIPAGCLAGLGAAPMWAAQSTYLTQVAYIYARVTQQPPEAAIVRFFGIFYLCWQSAELWGNLISGLVLSAPHTNETDASDYTLCAVILLIFLLDPPTMYGEQRGGGKVSVIKLLVATFRQLRKPNQLLLVPLTTFIGMEQANFAADLTQAFISCTLGISEIGFILVSFGLCNSLFSLIFGFLTKKFGRIWILIIGLIAISACYLIMLLWQPSPHQKWMFFLICCLYALGDSILQIQINGMYGAIFEKNKEAAFSNYRLFESLGYLVTYALSTVLCARTKLISALGLLVIGTVGWIVVEWRVKSSKSFESNKLDETKATHAEVYKVIEG
uniref:Putative conserved plasma membrane protein n=1 Tax=Lutzomyia longipalpis TaxID=7200 RepID=A0A1B0CQI4_LUTLO